MTPLALDIAIWSLILLSTWVGYLRGIIREAFMLLTIGVSVLLAYKGGHMLVPEFNQFLGVGAEDAEEKKQLVLGILSPPLAAKVFSYGGMFLFAFIGMTLLGHLVKRLVNEAGLALFDKLLGGGFGFIRGFMLVFLIYIPFNYMVPQEEFPVWAKESYTVPKLKSTLQWANERFELDKMIEDRGGNIAIKLKKINLEKSGAAASDAEEELKRALQQEEKDVQKGAPEQQPDKTLFNLSNPFSSDTPPPAPEPAPSPEAVPALPPVAAP